MKNILVENTLINQGEDVNMMNTFTMEMLQLPNLRPIPTVLESTNHSRVKPIGILEDVIVSLDSWEYHVDFLVVAPKSFSRGHTMILGKIWLETVDALIGCRSGEMIISN